MPPEEYRFVQWLAHRQHDELRSLLRVQARDPERVLELLPVHAGHADHDDRQHQPRGDHHPGSAGGQPTESSQPVRSVRLLPYHARSVRSAVGVRPSYWQAVGCADGASAVG